MHPIYVQSRSRKNYGPWVKCSANITTLVGMDACRRQTFKSLSCVWLFCMIVSHRRPLAFFCDSSSVYLKSLDFTLRTRSVKCKGFKYTCTTVFFVHNFGISSVTAVYCAVYVSFTLTSNECQSQTKRIRQTTNVTITEKSAISFLTSKVTLKI